MDREAIYNPLLTLDRKKNILSIAHLIQAYKYQDPPSKPSLAVPIELVEAVLKIAYKVLLC